MMTFFVACGEQSIETVAVEKDPILLSISAPEEVVAGETADIRFSPIDLPNNSIVQLIAVNSYETRRFVGAVINGSATITLPTNYTKESGEVSLFATADGYAGQATITILSDAPIEPLTPLVGSRTIVADAETWSMGVVVPFDQFNNPANDGEAFTFRAQHPDNSTETFTVETSHLVAWQRIFSHTTSGKTTVEVNGDNVFGSEATLIENAGWPLPFTLSADTQPYTADSRRLTLLQTSELRDQYDNLLPDGTQVTFVITAPNNRVRTLPAYTINGVAELPIEAPGQAQTISVQAAVYTVRSEPLTIDFAPSINGFTVTTEIDPLQTTVTVNAGPILGRLEQYVPDGSVVKLTIRDENGKQIMEETVVDTGYASKQLRLSSFDVGTQTVFVSVLGNTNTATFEVVR